MHLHTILAPTIPQRILALSPLDSTCRQTLRCPTAAAPPPPATAFARCPALLCPALLPFSLLPTRTSCSASSNVLALARLKRTISYYFCYDALLLLTSLRHKITIPTLKIWEKLEKRRRRKPTAQEPTGGPCTDDRSRTCDRRTSTKPEALSTWTHQKEN
ncbi:hypothetical protein BBK36DRAFT_1134597 [Trichoderma citrinoviride]|uniref:Uncharacterized protein n=1 Tax=Trichoderma citrinoviride TaxID=58853 RepID=A0A2T4BHV9_9HYPO|nr:hypothetical protein BBK36DRAFT_1134597 [Trichoderma citrinoviride]PTB68890.1 hypothetical protein BBK36DRAFT_1134597 [Trichoderma citrinoviride]